MGESSTDVVPPEMCLLGFPCFPDGLSCVIWFCYLSRILVAEAGAPEGQEEGARQVGCCTEPTRRATTSIRAMAFLAQDVEFPQ